MNEAALDVRKYFAEFGIRLAGIVLDLFVMLVFVAEVLLPALPSFSGTPLDTLPAVLAVLSLYFAAFWASPLKSTPVQFLFGMRVVDLNGERLTPGFAFLRAVMLMAMVGAALMFFRTPGDPWQLAGIVGLAALVPAIVSTNRQGVHDLLARSIVVNRTTLSSEKRRAALLAHLASPETATRPKRRPSIPRIVFDVLVLVVPVYMVWTVSLVAVDRDIRSRASYAVGEVSALKNAVAAHHEAYEEWPTADTDLGVPAYERYPDGGFFELQEDGVIRIRFEVMRQLKSGSLVLRPQADAEAVVWNCSVDGYIAPKHLPRVCRE